MSIIFDYAGDKKKLYFFSMVLSALSVVAGLIPFYFIADIINDLIAGKNAIGDYTFDIIMLLVFFFLKGVFHVVSTSLSH